MAPVTDWGGETNARIERVLFDLLWLTDPSRDDKGLMTFGERKVMGAAADLLREIQYRMERTS